LNLGSNTLKALVNSSPSMKRSPMSRDFQAHANRDAAAPVLLY
jgi:hypothetical protein